MAQPFKEPEHSHLVQFAHSYSGFPHGNLDFGPPNRVPDLIVHTAQGDLGIEHTQLFRVEAGPNKDTPQAQERLQNKVMARARQISESRNGPMVSLHTYFSHSTSLSTRTIEDVAERLVDVIDQTLRFIANPRQGTMQEFRLEAWEYERAFPGLFPSAIDIIMFNVVDSPGSVIWGAVGGGTVPKITIDYIQSKIDDKDEKLERYRTNCQEVWLLLVAENAVMSSYFNITDEVASHIFCSRFDRVFYFERFDDKIVELHIAAP